MLIACTSCHRQYDVGTLSAGGKIRCFCGELNEVKTQAAAEVRMLHCSHCGGSLEEGATRCAYCRSDVLLGDRGLGEVCPECFSRMVRDARFCSTCGVGISPQLVLKALQSQSCPRCDGQLALCEGGDVSFTECTACGGLWLEERVFEHFVTTRDASAVRPKVEVVSTDSTPQIREQGPVRYLACPTCGQLMQRKNFALRSGVIIDWCRGHGYWFDTHELEQIIAFVESPGFARAVRAEEELRRTSGPADPDSGKAMAMLMRDEHAVMRREDSAWGIIEVVARAIAFFLRG